MTSSAPCVGEAAAQRGLRVLSATGVESEMTLPFAGLHQLVRPLFGRLPALPAPQRRALMAAFGMTDKPASPPSASPSSPPIKRQRSLRLIYLLPLGFFACLALIFLVRLGSGGDPQAIPSALIGRPAPDFALEPLGENPLFTRAALDGKTTLVNVFASWCGPCRVEHPLLMELAKDPRIQVVGINYKDQPGNAEAFLDDLGNPYAAIATDTRGRAAIEWGVYGVPETFVVGPDGIIRHKVIGPITPETLERSLMPAIEKTLAQAN